MPVRKESEADRFVGIARQYKSMQVDMEHLRGKYFNMKKNREAEEKEMIRKNQAICHARALFQKDFEGTFSKTSVNNDI